MELELSYGIMALLVGAAFVAGFIDAIAGGGGMITLPALLFAGIPPLQALGTNKLQASFGSFSATFHFYLKGHIHLREHFPFVLVVFFASCVGTYSVQFFETDVLRKGIPFLLMVFGIYFLFSPKVTQESAKAVLGGFGLGFVLGGIGFYDGFFGPGTGSFLMLAMIVLGGFGIIEALAHAKLFNFATNLASVVVFAYGGGHVLWLLGFLMAIGQFLGANLGSRVALGYGVKIIKPLVVIVSFIACGNLLYREYF